MAETALNTGDTAWVLTSAAFVLLMLPGLALFYGGMTRSKGVLNMFMMVFGALVLVGVLWVLYGYSMTFAPDGGPFFSSPFALFGLEGLMVDNPEAALPEMAFVGFQAMFAAITVALIAGAVADRTKFAAWMVFGGIWATLVYFPVAHWVWSADGWIFNGEGPLNGVPAIDFAGGTAVHINAGAAALALVLVLGKRLGWPKTQMRPHNLPLVMLGAGLLWFGWFGFNAGSALAADNTASVVFVNTFAATCAATIGWLITEKIRDGHATSLGAASGMVAGLVAITPAGSAVSPLGALALGLIAGILCALAVSLKFKFGYDDSLDVVGVHLVGGLVGTLLIGFLATEAAPAGVNGLFYGGGTSQLWSQTVAALVVMVFSFVVALLIALAIKATMGFRIDEDDEVAGIDQTTHAEVAYELGNSGGGGGKFAGVGSSSVRSQEEVKA
ncbi:MAG: ammonium transporter [Actinomycetota bacterium]|nr:ammonium transporter [Actinomycetota bacterium]MDH4015757.1 ammonium transporter [Actinomycetota bacterium]